MKTGPECLWMNTACVDSQCSCGQAADQPLRREMKRVH